MWQTFAIGAAAAEVHIHGNAVEPGGGEIACRFGCDEVCAASFCVVASRTIFDHTAVDDIRSVAALSVDTIGITAVASAHTAIICIRFDIDADAAAELIAVLAGA